MSRPRLALIAATGVAAAVLAACGGGSSDVAGAGNQAGGKSTGTLSLYAYAVPKPGYDKIIPGFNATDEGKGIAFQQSYGASGDQSRKVAAGAEADVVNFSVEPDVTRLVDAGSGIKDWDDLLQPGLEVVTPNPFSSGSAKWNLLAPYAAKSEGGKNSQAGLDYLSKLVGDHVKIQPKSGREASEAFLQGTGDALLTYENEALFLERSGEKVDHVTPPATFKIENPIAVVNTSKNLAKAKAFVAYTFTPAAQKLWAQAGFRPVDPAVAEEFAKDFPDPTKLWTIADLGGWGTVDKSLFDKDNGSVAKIYDAATQ
jgi:sulfate transport system substrate-binding protein